MVVISKIFQRSHHQHRYHSAPQQAHDFEESQDQIEIYISSWHLPLEIQTQEIAGPLSDSALKLKMSGDDNAPHFLEQ